MNQDITQELRSWLDETISTIPDPVRIYPAVAADAQSSSQQRSWFPPLPTLRFRPMFSATKFVVTGVIVALFGGFLLIAQPLDQRDGGVPGAAQSDDPMAVAVFTGRYYCCHGGLPDSTFSETSEGFRLEVGGSEYGGIDVTDPRLSGDMIWTVSSLEIDAGTTIYALTVEVWNDGGRWIGTSTGADSDSLGHEVAVVLSGMDDYEGLTAYLVYRGDDVFTGAIFPGDMPSAPEPAQVDDPEALGS